MYFSPMAKTTFGYLQYKIKSRHRHLFLTCAFETGIIQKYCSILTPPLVASILSSLWISNSEFPSFQIDYIWAWLSPL